MAKFKGWKNRYSYLDNYKKGMDGTYVYYGRHYIFKGTAAELKKYKWTLGLADLLMLALFIVSGCLEAGVIWRSWYVVVPFAIEAIAVFLLIWKSLTLMMEKNPVKEHLYKKSVPWLKPAACILLGACVISACTTGLCMILNPEGIKLAGCVIYIILKLVMAAGSYLFIRILSGYEWELDPSEEPEWQE